MIVKQGVAAVADDLGKLTLLIGELGIQQETAHADDRIHGGADLVAHHRQEGALGGIGRFGFLAGFMVSRRGAHFVWRWLPDG